MSHTALHSFFRDCAQRDVLAVQHVLYATELVRKAQDIAILCDSYIHGQRDDVPVPLYMINACMMVAFSSAGEAVKQLKKTRPDLIAAYPDFPWDAFKRIRDEGTHHARSMIDSQNAIPSTSMQKNYEIIDKFFQAKPPLARPHVTEDPLIAQIGNGWDVVNLLMGLVRKYRGAGPPQLDGCTIPIQRTDGGPFRGYRSSNMVANLLPLTLKQNVTRQALNNLGDALNEMSPYCREYNDMPVEPRMILALRNRAAHFADMPDHARYGTPRLSSETEMAVAKLSPYLEKLEKFARSVPLDHLPPEQQAAFVDKVANYYEQRACASIRPERLGILNDTAAFICASRKNDPALRVAVVKAMANLLQVRPAERGQEVLDYLKRNGGAIRSPGKMRAQIEEVPQATRAALNAYLREVVELYSPLGEGCGHLRP